MGDERPVIAFDDAQKVLTINGVKYSYGLFSALGLGGVPEGHVLRIVKREEGMLTIQRLYPAKDVTVFQTTPT